MKTCRRWSASRPPASSTSWTTNGSWTSCPSTAPPIVPAPCWPPPSRRRSSRQIEAVCEHAGLKMRRLLLRPCEAALLLEGEKSIPARASGVAGESLGRRGRSDGRGRWHGGLLAHDPDQQRPASLAGPAGRDPPHDGRGLEPIGRPEDRVDRALRRTASGSRSGPRHRSGTGRFTSNSSIPSAA